MASAPIELSFDRQFDPQTGQPVIVAPGIVRVTAPNASAYTFTGTNSFLIGRDALLLVDPGPDDTAHFGALREAVGNRKVTAVLLTHTHKDHSALARRIANAVSAPVWFGGAHRQSRPSRFGEINPIRNACDWSLQPDRVLHDGETIRTGDMALEVVATPGHCANHLAFGIKGTDHILTGDHVMGWNSTLVAVPDGSMRDYLASLNKLLSAPHGHYLPAHGGSIADGRTYTEALKVHRLERNRQILDALANRTLTSWQLVRHIYPGIAANVLPAAHMTLKAHLEYLAERGDVRLRRTLFGMKARRIS